MSASWLVLIVAMANGQSAAADTRPRNPLAPSLPLLTAKEEKRFEDILDRFIQYDIGKLPGPAGKKAVADFNQLPPEAVFALIDGFNRTVVMEHSCPVVLIGKKIIRILNASEDLELLTFARENLGAGQNVKRHQGMLKDVQFAILLRKGAVQRKLAVSGAGGTAGLKASSSMSLADLLKAADTKKGAQLKPVLTEIEKRQGAKVVDALAQAAGSPDKDVKFLGAGLLAKHMTRQTSPQLKNLLKHDRPEVKAAAAKEIGARGKSVHELLDLLDDSDPTVHQAARAALVQLGRGTVDYGPSPEASVDDRQTAKRRWQEWLEKSR